MNLCKVAGIGGAVLALVVLPGFAKPPAQVFPFGPLGKPVLLVDQVETSNSDTQTTACPNMDLIPGLVLTPNLPVRSKAVIELVLSALTLNGGRVEAFIEVDGVLLNPNVYAVSIEGTEQQTGCTKAVISLPPGPHTIRALWQANKPCGSTGLIPNRQATLSIVAFMD